MPQKSGFFDTTADDPREYPAREFAEYFSRFVGNGIFGGGEKLKVTTSGKDMNVSVNLGYGWISGYMYAVYDTPLVLPIEQATTQNRIDRIVLRLDVSTPVRAIRAIVLQGNPAATPQAPAIVRSGDIYDLSLAQVLVKANTSTIQPFQITDERLNNQVCGIVTGVIQQADTTSIFNQFQSWLNTKTAEYQKQWDDFLKSVQDEGFATTQYVDQKASQAETNAKNASLPRSGGTITGGLAVNGALTVQSRNIITELDSVKQSGVERKAEVAGAINAKGVPASASDDWSTLVTKIGLIQTEKGTTNLAQNFWSSVYRNTVSGKFCFMDGKIISAYSKQVDTTTRFGRREVDYNGTILNEREFVNESYNPGGLLRGVIASPGMVARYGFKNKQIEVYNDVGTLLYRIPYDSGSWVSDIILARGSLFFYNARNGKLCDSSGNILVSLFEETFFNANRYASYFVDVNTLVVDTAEMNTNISATIRWYNGAWRVDSTSNSSDSYMAMYLAALAAR